MDQRLNNGIALQSDIGRLDAGRVSSLAAWVGTALLILMLAFSLGGGNGFSATERAVENGGNALAIPVDRAQEPGRTFVASALRTRPTPVGTGGNNPHKAIDWLVPASIPLVVPEPLVNRQSFADPTHRAASGLFTRRMTAGPPRA